MRTRVLLLVLALVAATLTPLRPVSPVSCPPLWLLSAKTVPTMVPKPEVVTA